MTDMKINSNEIAISGLSMADAGKVFEWNGRIFRGFDSANTSQVKELLAAGLIQRLVNEKLFVKTWVSDIEFESFAFVLEHEKVQTVIYPREWTYTMLKDAALLVLRINKIAKEYGYKTIDCHGYNVLFHKGSPVYVDIGSFAKTDINDDVLAPYHEFLRAYYYPLWIWSEYGGFLGQSVLPHGTTLLPSAEYLKLRFKITKMFSDRYLNKFMHGLHVLRSIKYRDPNKLSSPIHQKLYNFFSKNLLRRFFNRKSKIVYLRKTVLNQNNNSTGTYWSDYHNEFDQANPISSIPRFSTIIEKVKSLSINSILEIAGNQGALSIELSKLGIQKVMCSDYDSNALDLGYKKTSGRDMHIDWITLNPFDSCTYYGEATPEQRFRADLVIGLAVSHHLILSQNLSIHSVIEAFSRYTNKYIMIEFMPLGLHNGKSAPPVPEWYTIDRFKFEFEMFFNALSIDQLEDNRVLFVGSLKSLP